MDTKWVKESFDKGKQEVLKFAKTSKIKIDITSLKKKKDERIKLLGNKVLELIEAEELDADLFEPDFSYIKNIDADIAEKEAQLHEEAKLEAEDSDETITEDFGIVTIEAQKVLTAKSIPVEPVTEPKKDVKRDYSI